MYKIVLLNLQVNVEIGKKQKQTDIIQIHLNNNKNQKD